jgi:ketosteroid isomerase-like protein
MSQEDVEVVRRMYEAFHRGDAEGALAHFDPDVVVDATMRVDAGIGHGREQLYAVVGRWLGAFDEWREEIEELRDLGSQVCVVSTQHGRGKGSGIETESRYAVLYEVRGNRITRMTLYASPAEALAAAGLSE